LAKGLKRVESATEITRPKRKTASLQADGVMAPPTKPTSFLPSELEPNSKLKQQELKAKIPKPKPDPSKPKF
jgi:hypothetical protein